MQYTIIPLIWKLFALEIHLIQQFRKIISRPEVSTLKHPVCILIS
jgi:hypothetical protein